MTSPSNKEKIVVACRRIWEQSGRGKMLLALSGGADSTALLLAFSKARIPFEAAHCNFNLRSSESLRDREFVKVLCKNFNVPLHIKEFDVAKEARKGESTEMTCRRIRYEFFHNLKKEGSFSRIAVAHNADDNIETFFMHALRGSGTRGLKSMEIDSGEILRPLLNYRRRELLEFLKANNQIYVTDSSNLKSEDYRRNFLRNEIFPLLESKWDGFAKAVSTTIDVQRRENRIIEHFISKALEGVTDFLPWHVVYNFPDAETLIFRFINPYGGTPTLAKEMAASAARLLPGKQWRVSDDISVTFTRKGIQIDLPQMPTPIENPEYAWSRLEGSQIDFDKITSAKPDEIYLPFGEDRYEWTEANIKMKIKPLGLQGSQPVWKILKDQGISPANRKNFKVLVDKESGEPIWLPGIKRSRLHLLAPDSTVAFHISKTP